MGRMQDIKETAQQIKETAEGMTQLAILLAAEKAVELQGRLHDFKGRVRTTARTDFARVARYAKVARTEFTKVARYVAENVYPGKEPVVAAEKPKKKRNRKASKKAGPQA